MAISNDTDHLSPHDLLQCLMECDSRDAARAIIASWLRANPRPRTTLEILERVDEALAPWYAAYGDPRPRTARREELVSIVEKTTGCAQEPLGARLWLFEWLETPNAQLDGHRPEELLDTSQDFERLKALLLKS
jgi:hypothetical protein